MHFINEYLHSKLARRMFALFFAAALLPLLLTVTLSYQEVSQLIENERASQLKRDNKQLSLLTYERLTNIQGKLQTILGILRAEEEVSLETKSLLHTFVSGITIVDSQSGLIRDILGKRSQDILPALEIDSLTTTSSTLFTAPNRDTIQADIYFAQKLRFGEQHTQYLIAKVRPDYLWPSDQLPFETKITVFDSSGQMLQPLNDFELEPRQLYSLVDPELKIQPLIEIGREHYLVSRRNLFMHAQFNSSDWIFIGIQPFRYAVSDLVQFRNHFIPPILLSLMLISLVSLAMIRRNMKPVEQLLKGTKRIALNNFDHRIEAQSDDEFGELAESFNTMTEKLKHQFEINERLSKIDQLILENASTDDIAATVISGLGYILPAKETCLILNDPEVKGTGAAYILSDFSNYYCKHTVDLSAVSLDKFKLSHENHKLSGNRFSISLQTLMYYANVYTHDIPISEEDHSYGLLLAANQTQFSLNNEEFARAKEYSSRVSVALAAQSRNRLLAYQANIDSLTNIPNRRQMKREVHRAIDMTSINNNRGAMIFIDLDRFKHVNDAYGHPVGDQLLIQAAERLSECLGPSQVVARFGGDEFSILMPTIVDVESVELLAEKVKESLSRPFHINDIVSYVGSSLGIALFPDHADNFDELLQKADTAMYMSKRSGRNQYTFYQPEMGVSSLNRSVMEHEIRLAIVNDAFDVYYQPKVCIKTGNISGFEALLRWKHETMGFISPADIIPVAEESELINDLGDWVTSQVCRQIVIWQDKTPQKFSFAVNVSSIQLMSDGYLERLTTIIQQTGVDPSYLEIEITEGLFLSDQQATTQILDQVHQLGIKIAVDDFGTGFSSLSYLSQLPIDTLKIDRCFIQLMGASKRDEDLVKTIVAMADSLNLNVVAEGVETIEELEMLMCFFDGEIQGYFFSKPLHVHGVEEMINNVDRFASKIKHSRTEKLLEIAE